MYLYADCLLEAYIKLVMFSVQYLHLIQVKMMAQKFNVNVITDFRAGGTSSFAFRKALFSGSQM